MIIKLIKDLETNGSTLKKAELLKNFKVDLAQRVDDYRKNYVGVSD